MVLYMMGVFLLCETEKELANDDNISTNMVSGHDQITTNRTEQMENNMY